MADTGKLVTAFLKSTLEPWPPMCSTGLYLTLNSLPGQLTTCQSLKTKVTAHLYLTLNKLSGQLTTWLSLNALIDLKTRWLPCGEKREHFFPPHYVSLFFLFHTSSNDQTWLAEIQASFLLPICRIGLRSSASTNLFNSMIYQRLLQ